MELTPFFDLTLDLVFVAGKDGYFKNVNKAAIEKFGYTKDELFIRPISDFIHPEDRTLTKAEREKLLTGEPLVNFQNRYISKHGKEIWLEWTSIYLPDQELVFAIAKDVTVRKTAELEIEAKYKKAESLAQHFKSNIERERKFLSASLHEDLAQLLAVLKIDIDWIKRHKENLPQEVIERLEHADTISGLLMQTIQRISFSISPGMLGDLGLLETLKWLCNELSAIGTIRFSVDGVLDELRLSKEMKFDLFRICQEALHNVVHHSLADTALLKVKETANSLLLTITDDGRGFNESEHKDSPGLKIMRERAAIMNASFVIKSKPGKGTVIELELPYS